MRVPCPWITSFRENRILRKLRHTVFVSDGAGKLDVLFRYSAVSDTGNGARVGHFRQTHDDVGRRPFLRYQVVVDANDRTIPNTLPISQSRACFDEVQADEY